MNFEKDLRLQIIQLLEGDKIKFNEQVSTNELLINYLNALNRRISINKRKVFMSDNIEKVINSDKLDNEYLNTLFKFRYNFENGIDMNGHLSSNIYYSNLYERVKKNIYRKSRDFLLDDWGIYHFHLKERDAKSEEEMHANRSKHLLFAKITNTEAYFIDILNHNEESVFSKQELLETLDRNWHFILEKHMLPELTSCSKFTDKEINIKRQKGCLLLYEINGIIYACMGGGLTSAGTNIAHTARADNILDDMQFIEEDLKNNYTSIKNDFKTEMGIKSFKKLDFKFILDVKGYVVVEVNSGFALLYFYEDGNFKRRSGKLKNKC